MSSQSQGQSTHLFRMNTAIAGQLAQPMQDLVIVSAVAANTLSAGLLVEQSTSTSKIDVPKSASLGKVLGIVMYSAGHTANHTPGNPPTGGEWQAGDTVPVCRRGRIWAKFHSESSTAASLLGALNVWHPSDNSHTLQAFDGYLTADTTSSTTGEEISALGETLAVQANLSTDSVVLAEVDFFGKAA